MEQHALKIVSNRLNTNIYSYLETSGGQRSNLYLNVAHFLTPVLIRHLWQLKMVVFLHCPGGTKVQQETRHPKIEGLSPTVATGREKNGKKYYKTFNKVHFNDFSVVLSTLYIGFTKFPRSKLLYAIKLECLRFFNNQV